jgi:two-component system chemotaxis sensor kinase CheA
MSDSDIVQDFLAESYENLDRLDRELVGLEKNPHDREALSSVFRTIHTIKGTCGFLGFNKLEKIAHVGENLLTRLRDGQLMLNPELTTALLGMVDAVRQMLQEIQSTGQDGQVDYPELRETLTRLHQVSTGAARPIAAAESPAKTGGCITRTGESNCLHRFQRNCAIPTLRIGEVRGSENTQSS